MSEKASKGMSTVQEAIGVLAGPFEGNRKGWLGRVKVEGVSYRTVRSFWYREIEDETHLAARALKRAAEIEKAKREAQSLAARYETIARGLNVTDQDFHREDVAALLHAARILRGQDSP